jgi:hypothetical protein
MTEPTKSPYRIFLSYRRQDEPDFVLLVYSWLVNRYGRENVFMDFQSTPSGAQFDEVIREEVKNCDALVAIIGPKWKTIMRERAFDEEDYVRLEIGLALDQKKQVVPVQIKGADWPQPGDLPKECKGMLGYENAVLQSGEGFMDSMQRLLTSLDRILAVQVPRRQEAGDLDAVSPASGLALGYYINFLRPVLHSLTELNPAQPDEYLSSIEVSERDTPQQIVFAFGQAAGAREHLQLSVIIPPRIGLVRGTALAAVRRDLKQASIRISGSARPYLLDARQAGQDFQLVDFPTTITALESWLKRRMKQESLKLDSEEALRLEHDELGRFERMLKWWAEDELLAPEFKDRVQITAFNPEASETSWLAPVWKVGSRSSAGS